MELSLDIKITGTKWNPENRLTLNMVNRALANIGVKTTVSESSVSQHTQPSRDKTNLDSYHILHVTINHKQIYHLQGEDTQDQENSDFSSLQQSRVYELLLAIKRVQRGFQGLLMVHPRSHSHGVSFILTLRVCH